jgi:hypothetical protein
MSDVQMCPTCGGYHFGPCSPKSLEYASRPRRAPRVPTPDGERAETLSKEYVAVIRRVVGAAQASDEYINAFKDVQDLCDSHEQLRSDLATARAERQDMELELRKHWWLGHGHRGIYGDDGEMQCAECGAAYGVWDYKRATLHDVRLAFFGAQSDRLRAAMGAASPEPIRPAGEENA